MTRRLCMTGSSERGLTAYIEALRSCAPDLELCLLLPGQDEAALRASLAGAAGLLLTGGVDIHPQEYGEAPRGTEMEHVQPARDSLERLALRHADEHGLPTFAICRGMQMLNVHRGGALLQDIDRFHRDGRAQQDKWMSWHGVDFLAGTHLARLFPDDLGLANSRHHQAVDPERIGEGLQAVAWCGYDDTVEGIESIEGERFVLGVQWHPENMALAPEGTPERRQARALFELFATRVREFGAGAAK